LKLQDQRRERYREKLEKLDESIKDIQNWHTGTEDLLDDRTVRKAVYKSFQEGVEVVNDICAMFLSDSEKVVADDSGNIEKASGELFPREIESALVEANGLRNRVVHDYNGFDDRTALNSIQNRIEGLESFREEVREWIENS